MHCAFVEGVFLERHARIKQRNALIKQRNALIKPESRERKRVRARARERGQVLWCAREKQRTKARDESER